MRSLSRTLIAAGILAVSLSCTPTFVSADSLTNVTNQYTELQEIYDSETSGEYFDRIYTYLKNQGFSDDVARNSASRQANNYQYNRLFKLTDALYDYGLTDNGNLNTTGVRILSLINDEVPQLGTYYSNMLRRDTDITPEEYAAAKASFSASDYKESSGEYFDSVYKSLQDNGYSEDIASDVASKRANEFQKQRISDLTNALYTYGINHGTINPIGVRIIAMIGSENPQAVDYYLTMFK